MLAQPGRRDVGQHGLVRIVSLLPSATEIVYALGAEGDLVGVTHECDWPPDARTKTQVTRSLLPPNSSAAEIDRLVSAAVSSGTPTETLDSEALRGLDPDIILTQDLCAVCAVPAGDVDAALDRIGCHAEVVSLDPSNIEDILADILRVGGVLGRQSRADTLVAAARSRLDAVAAAVAGKPRPRVVTLEWSDPPYNAGHWLPDLVTRAGAEPLLGNPGIDSVRITWEAVAAADADAIVFAPCGYNLNDAASEAKTLLDIPAVAAVPRFYAVDADAYFVRPGPRIVNGVELLSDCLHGDPARRSGPGWARLG